MRVVGIDQSYTGFGFCTEDNAIKKGFPNSKFENEVERLHFIRNWIEELLEEQHSKYGVSLVVMEGYANGAKFGREMAGELGGVVKLATYDVIGKPPMIVPPPSLKKFVTGKGNAKKNEMLLGVFKRWGVSFSDDNQADAYALEKFGRTHLWLLDDPSNAAMLPKFQVDAIEAVHKGK